MAEIISEHTGQDYEQVEKDIDRDRFMTAEEAKSYGIVDNVLSSRKAAELAALKTDGALMAGEPARLVETDEEPSPAAKPES
jgi:ClpP class serine protease